MSGWVSEWVGERASERIGIGTSSSIFLLFIAIIAQI